MVGRPLGPGAGASRRGPALTSYGTDRHRDAEAEPQGRVDAQAPARHEPDRFPIIGIGASAGGLEALEVFLRHVPDKDMSLLHGTRHLLPLPAERGRVLPMARQGLRYQLSNAFGKALRSGRAVTVRGLEVGTNGGTQVVDLTVQKLAEPEELDGTVIVVLADVPAPSKPARAGRSRRPPGSSS